MIIISCAHKVNKETQKPKDDTEVSTKTAAGPPVFVYKTKKDYYQNVPIILNETKTEIVSYPGINDIKKNNSFTYPTRLENGYLLDNRGIDKNTAFLSMTYEAYGSLENTPSVIELKEMILDMDPFLELYRCGTRYDYKDIVNELNKKISSGEFSEFEKLK
jgi:hypothetical protein